jgi:membrane peptidoglycan carboxypeptidase
MIAGAVGDSDPVKNLFRRVRSWSWKKRLAIGSGSTVLVLLLALVLGYVLTDIPQPSKIATDQATKLTYSSGAPMGTIGKNRTIKDLKDISKDAQHAVLAAEDRNFYSEPGISPKGIARALFANVRAGGVSEGGSTITQQYAKNAFLTQERTFSRKIKEVFIAVKMSQQVSKDTILKDYLNTIYFGRGAYGIEAAASTYFRTSAAKLTVAQSAVLASSIKSPALYDPAKHPEAAKKRFAYVLDGMVKSKWLTAADQATTTYPKVFPRSSQASFPGSLDYIREQVVAELATHNISEAQVAAGGLTVRTTIDHAAQDAAIAAVEAVIPTPTGDNPPVGALVSIEPGSGRVKAYYGGEQGSGFDYASDGKVQPGSSMKPYVLAAALEEGKSLTSRYDGSSPQAICGDPEVKNDGGDPPFGQVDLATGLAHSVNTVYYRLACDVGPSKVRDLAHAAGLPAGDTLQDESGKPTAQIALGSGGYELHPIDQAVGYATFAANGVRATPKFVEAVYKNGHQIYGLKPNNSRAFSADVAADAVSAMQQVVTDGTATRAQLAGGRPVAGKTGTTSQNTNAWFCGFTPQLSTTVWVGLAKGGPLKDVEFKTGKVSGGVYGGRIPAQIFKAYMDKALEGKPVKQFPDRANVGTPVTSSATSAPTATATATASPSASPTTVVTVPPSTVPSAPPTLVPTLQPSPSSSPSASPDPPQPSDAASPSASP